MFRRKFSKISDGICSSVFIENTDEENSSEFSEKTDGYVSSEFLEKNRRNIFVGNM